MEFRVGVMVHMSRTLQPTVYGHKLQFHWASAGVKGNTCLSQPLYHYYSDLSVPDVHILLFLPKKMSHGFYTQCN